MVSSRRRPSWRARATPPGHGSQLLGDVPRHGPAQPRRRAAGDAHVLHGLWAARHRVSQHGDGEGPHRAAAAVYVTHGVAGIGWVGTVPDHRGKGYGEAVTWATIQEGFRRGAAIANLQASSMGRPIYERMGFITATEYRVFFGKI